ncbi:hypothetical protein OOZ51_13145 [Arthrobacter sp. MI7-26]|uniref:hypothetical protein n=1 Tax=Arthrobacter sp. MI7-26 TaxID=2993653 RepID=UPI002248F55A|nr:hypothetical protein [Arthrobacter sp. MI7-26]MCX2748750.1 hypothetical protein [Arthrobacter sp. MI7-26]
MFNLTDRIDIQVKSRHALDDQLAAAVQHLQETALRERTRGILITRHRPGHYTAELSEQVPFGITRELCR